MERRLVDEILDELIHKMADSFVEDVRIGLFYTGVKLSNGSGGVAYTPKEDAFTSVCCPKSYRSLKGAGTFSGSETEELVGLIKSRNPFKRAIGVATINAASSNLLFDEGRYDVMYDMDALDLVEIGPDDRVGMIGAFTPYIGRLKGKVKGLNVFERNEEVMKEYGLKGLGPDAYEVLEESNVVIITGATFVTGTIEDVLKHVGNARDVLLVGPTASMLPDPLFKRGVTAIGGVRMDDVDTMLKVVGEGGSGYTLGRCCARKFVLKKS